MTSQQKFILAALTLIVIILGIGGFILSEHIRASHSITLTLPFAPGGIDHPTTPAVPERLRDGDANNKQLPSRHVVDYHRGTLQFDKWVVIGSGNVCGTVKHNDDNTDWDAYAYEDESRDHWFPTHDAAAQWLEKNWCPVQQ